MTTWKPNLFTRLATTAAVLAVTFTGGAKAGNTLNDHDDLYQAVENVGVPVVVNHPKHCKDNWGGGMFAWSTSDREAVLLVCQDNGQKAGQDNQVEWTANDLDTLRHEAHHLVQDCLAGPGMADGIVEPVLEGDKYWQVVRSYLSVAKINEIADIYEKEDHLIEFEAFAVAAGIDASVIANAVTRACAS